jgi:ketosteroid isomerase-like protein
VERFLRARNISLTETLGFKRPEKVKAMTLEQQKDRARDFIRALDRGDEATLADLTSTNFTFEVMTCAPGVPRLLDRARFLTGLVKMLREMLPNGFNYQIGVAIAEGPHVSMQGTCDTIAAAGKKYTNLYHWYFRFDGDKIDQFREYMDSYSAIAAPQ